jgi:hypothetical protein
MAQESKIKISGVVGARAKTGIDSPHADDTVNSRFEAFGTVDPPGTAVTADVQSKTTNQRFQGTPVAPPDGENWACSFDVPLRDHYVLSVVANASWVGPVLSFS